MNLSLVDDSTIRLSFDYHEPTVAFVKSLGGEYAASTRTWTVGLHHLRRILTRYPGATFDRACVDARIEQWKRWIVQHNWAGFWFCYDVDGETVTVIGENVSPCFAEWAGKHSTVLATLLDCQIDPSPQEPVTMLAEASQPSKGEELVWRGIVNAQRREERKTELIEKVRKGKKSKVDLRQGLLIEG